MTENDRQAQLILSFCSHLLFLHHEQRFNREDIVKMFLAFVRHNQFS
jgi:hypothetical protein